MKLPKHYLVFFWQMVRSPDGRQAARWVSKDLISIELVGQWYLEGRLRKRVRLPDWF